MFEAVVYFASPRSVFSGKMHEEDVILRAPRPWRWLARRLAKGVHAQLDPTRCGYVIVDGAGEVLEHVEPQLLARAQRCSGKTAILGQ